MIEFGKTLREAREAKGYNVSQLADATHILPQIIENLEKEDFTKIVAPIYGRGFVKLYCETVGIDPKPLIAEFMEIYNGNRPPAIRLREADPVAPDAAPPPPSEPVPAEPPPSEPAPEPAEEPREPAPLPEPPAFDFSTALDSARPSASSMQETPLDGGMRRDYRLPGYSMPEVPRKFWRLGLLAVITAAAIALAVFGAQALYRATMRAPQAQPPPAGRSAQGARPAPAAASHGENAGGRQPATRPPRKPIAVPPLYID